MEEVDCVSALKGAQGAPHRRGATQQQSLTEAESAAAATAVAAAAARVNIQNNPLAVQIAVTQVREGRLPQK